MWTTNASSKGLSSGQRRAFPVDIVRSAVQQLGRATDSGDACRAALDACLTLGAAVQGAIAVENAGAHLDEGCTEPIRKVLGHDIELPGDLATWTPENVRERPRGEGSSVVIPFSNAEGDRGWVVLVGCERPDDAVTWSALVVEPLALALLSFARRDGYTSVDALPADGSLAREGKGFAGAGIGALRRTLQMGSRCPFPTTVVVFGFDALPELRRRSGRPAAEHLIRSVLRLVSRACRATDLVFPLGQDEWLLILPMTDLAGGVRVAEELRDRVGQLRLEFSRADVATTLALGVAPTEIGELNPRVAIGRARHAFGMARASGGDRLVEANITPVQRRQ